MEIITGKILKENLVHSAFQQTLGEEFPFQKDNLKHKAKSTLELLYQVTVLTYICLKIYGKASRVAQWLRAL